MQITLINDWQEIADFDCVFQLRTTGFAEIKLAAELPSESAGIVIKPLDINQFEFREGLKLWARSDRVDAVLEVQEV